MPDPRRAAASSVLVLMLCGCVTYTDPVDYLINLGTFPRDPALRAPGDGARRVVVLRHGLFRSPASLWKLERALRDHGYEVFNTGYASTRDYVEDHAARFELQLEAFLGSASDPRPVRLMFVGHSMGGLQMRAYLARPGARQPEATVFIATPQRGSALAVARQDWFLFWLLMGHEGALQLRPGEPLYDGLPVPRGDFGVVYGGYCNGVGNNDDVPGDDDGTVSVDEVQLDGCRDSVRLPVGHTFLAIDDAAVHQVLYFLLHRQFDHSR